MARHFFLGRLYCEGCILAMKQLTGGLCPTSGNQAAWILLVGSQVLAGCKSRACSAQLAHLPGRSELQCLGFAGVLQQGSLVTLLLKIFFFSLESLGVGGE